jgi:hypothetical protein
MATPQQYAWRRDREGLGIWAHRGKVAVAGYGHSPVDRRWDGTSMDKTLGAYTMLACQRAMARGGHAGPDRWGPLLPGAHRGGQWGERIELGAAAVL